MRSDSVPVLREAVFEDVEGVRKLKRAVGFTGDLPEDWDWLWRNNPAWRDCEQTPSMGWVLEAEGQIVGYLGSISTLHRYRDKTLRSASTTGFAVDPAYRGYTLRLVSAFFKQADKDILLNTTAIEVAGRIFQRFNAFPLPQRDYDQVLYWVLRPRPFINAGLKYMKLHPVVARAGSYLLAVPLKGYIAARRKAPQNATGKKRRPTELRLLDVSEIGQEFDDLWERKVKEETRVMSYRTAEVLRWHFAKVRAKVLCCNSGGALAGYAIVTREDHGESGLARSKIVDLFVEGDDPELVNQLLRGAYDHAKSDGSHVLEVTGFPTSIRDALRRANPNLRQLRTWPYYYAVLDRDIDNELQNGQAWYACTLDGDASLF